MCVCEQESFSNIKNLYFNGKNSFYDIKNLSPGESYFDIRHPVSNIKN